MRSSRRWWDQWVVALRPSSSPAAARIMAPVQTDPASSEVPATRRR